MAGGIDADPDPETATGTDGCGQSAAPRGLTERDGLVDVDQPEFRVPEAPNWSHRLITSTNQHLADMGTTKSTPHGATGALGRL